MQTRLMKIQEVAEILDVTEDRAYQMAREGLLPVVRLGRQIRIDQGRLQDWIDRGGQGLA